MGTLLAIPSAEGLFRRAIMESGSAHHVTGAPTARQISQYLAEKLGVAATREAIAAIPLRSLANSPGGIEGRGRHTSRPGAMGRGGGQPAAFRAGGRWGSSSCSSD